MILAAIGDCFLAFLFGFLLASLSAVVLGVIILEHWKEKP